VILLYRNLIQLCRAAVGLPGALLSRPRQQSQAVNITSANSATRCGRCGRDFFQHLWILIDSDNPEQDGVIDCAGVNS
jgi:hypothetical protein